MQPLPWQDKDSFSIVRNFNKGYQNNSDITSTDPNVLVPPSQNVLVTGDTIKCVESRAGYKLLGRAKTQQGGGIRSKYDEFVNALGIKLPVREYVDSNSSISNVEVFYDDGTGFDWHKIYGSDPYPIHELYFTEWYDDTLSLPLLIWTTGNDTYNSWHGGISTVTGVTATTITVADPIAQLGFTPSGTVFINGSVYAYTAYSGNTFTGVTPNPVGLVNPGDIATEPVITNQLLYLNIPVTNSVIKFTSVTGIFQEGEIITGGTSGATSTIIDIPTNDTLSISNAFGGSFQDGETITGSTSGATATILNVSDTPLTLDVCATINNHVFYGSYNTRNIYVSNSFQSKSVQRVTQAITTLDDIVISGSYSGNAAQNIKIEIVADVPQPQLTSNAASVAGLDDVIWGGTHTGNAFDVYQVSIVANAPDLFVWSINGGAPVGPLPCTVTPTVLANGITISFGNGAAGHTIGQSFTIQFGRANDLSNGSSDLYTWYLQDFNGNYQVQGSNIPITTPLNYGGALFQFQSALNSIPSGHKKGDQWIISLVPPVAIPQSDIYFSQPERLPGQGAIIKVDSPPVTLIPQEQYLYVNTRSGIFTTFHFQLSQDLLSEKIIPQRLKTDFSNKSLKQSLVTHTKNYIAYVNIENQLVNLGRVEDILATPMSEVISNPVKNDFMSLPFVVSEDGNLNGHVDWADNKIFITVPAVGLWYIYDDFYGIWQPPMTGNFSAISVINGQICAHSSISDETYVLFSASNDNGYPFTSIAAFSYDSNGYYPGNGYGSARDRLKEVQELFTEGYKTENTNLYAKVNLEWGDAKGGPDKRLDPKVYTYKDTASLGKASLAKHGLANDPVRQLTKFRHILPFNREFVYETQIIYYASNIDQYFKIISTGLDSIVADQRNVQIKVPAGTQITPAFDGVAGTPPPLNTAGGGFLPDDIAQGINTGGAG